MSNLWQQLNHDLSNTIETARRSLVQIKNGRGVGSGTIWREDGLIITNAHVIHERANVNVTLPDGRTLAARVLAQDADLDLAALHIEANHLPTIQLGNSKKLQPGAWVFALGHPWGVLGAATAGIVIDMGYPPELPVSRGEFVQVGLPLRPGHSGGPLVDVAGRLVGINTMISGPEVGLAVPVHVVKAFLRQALQAQTVVFPTL